MFVIDRNRDLVGFSAWPWDKLYEPLVGCFQDGRLVARGVCDRDFQVVGIQGPLESCWFRMSAPPEVRLLLEQGDPSIVMVRLEDGALIPPARPTTFDRKRAARVEEFFGATSSNASIGLTGFASFLKAPLHHQVEVLYLDILGRKVDPPARAALMERLGDGESFLSIRRDLFLCDELMERGVRPSSKLGSLITSGIWNLLREGEPLGARWRTLPQVELSTYAHLSTEEFVRRLFDRCMMRSLDPKTHDRLTELADENGRTLVASIIVRDAASTGAFFDLTD